MFWITICVVSLELVELFLPFLILRFLCDGCGTKEDYFISGQCFTISEIGMLERNIDGHALSLGSSHYYYRNYKIILNSVIWSNYQVKSIKNQRDPIFQTTWVHPQDCVIIFLKEMFWLDFVEFSPKFHCFRLLPSAMDKSLNYYYFRANLKVYLRVVTHCFESNSLQQPQFTGCITILTKLYCFL